MRIGLFGGTFDPPHTGHLIAAQDALLLLGLDRVVFIPAALPPHKQTSDISPVQIRLALVRAAIAGDARFEVDDLEVRRGGPSYTVDTLREYLAARPGAELFLILGEDQYQELDTWREAEAVRSLARLAVMTRAGRVIEQSREGITPLIVTRVDISATEIRRRVSALEPIRYLVPRPVENLIHEHRLYRGGAG